MQMCSLQRAAMKQHSSSSSRRSIINSRYGMFRGMIGAQRFRMSENACIIIMGT
jgi:hypothetical protein